MKREHWLNLVRLFVSAGLLAWILSRVGLEALLELARQADPAMLMLAGGLSVAGIVVRGWRWQVLLNAVGARPPFLRLVYLYFVGQFFSAFLPTGFAGDVVRVLEVGRGVSSEQAAGTVLVDRLTGFSGLFALALLALPFSRGLLPAEWAWAITLLALAVVGGSALLFEGRTLRRLREGIGRVRQSSLRGRRRDDGAPASLLTRAGVWATKTYDVVTACGWRAVLAALGISTIFNLAQTAANVVLARSLGVSASPLYFFLFIPIATVALLVPVSISGLGVREPIYLTLFASPAVGLTAAQAVALSLGAYALDFLNALIGGGLYFAAGMMGLRRKRES